MDPLTVIAVAAALLGGYYLSVRWWPYTKCGRCSGSGTNAGSNGKRWGNCRRCGGSGRRFRFGTRLFFRRR